jgi:hypothetical protein
MIGVACTAAIALSSCSTTTDGTGTPGSGTAAAKAGPTATPTDAASLGAALRRGAASMSSAHVTMDVILAGQSVHGAGDETLAGGKATGIDLTESVPGLGTIRLILAGGKLYVRLPASLNHTGKPWVLVRADSSDSLVRTLAASLSSLESSASLDSLKAFTASAKSVKLDGAETIGGVPAAHYSIVVDVTKLPDTIAGKQALEASGITTLPVELWIDRKNRPVKMSEHLTVQGQQADTEVSLSRFDAPVHISAPAPDQVSTS